MLPSLYLVYSAMEDDTLSVGLVMTAPSSTQPDVSGWLWFQPDAVPHTVVPRPPRGVAR